MNTRCNIDIKKEINRKLVVSYNIQSRLNQTLLLNWDIKSKVDTMLILSWDISSDNAFVVRRNGECLSKVNRVSKFCG